MDFKIIPTEDGTGTMTFSAVKNSPEHNWPDSPNETTVMNNIWLSLMIPKDSFFADRAFGSYLYLLKRAKKSLLTIQRIKDYIRDALGWMIETGRLVSIDPIVTDSSEFKNRYYVEVKAVQSNNQPITYAFWQEVI
jgi:phage gp46-like protein